MRASWCAGFWRAEQTARYQRRQPKVPLERSNRIRQITRALAKGIDELFPIEHYQDKLGRHRTRGHRLRVRAFAFLQALTNLQTGAQSGVVIAGLAKIGRAFRSSRSTAWRAGKDLRDRGLLGCRPGGGKTHDENGRTVACASEYFVPDELKGPKVPATRRTKLGRQPARPLGETGRSLIEEGREWVAGLREKARSRGSPAA